jgi:ABC-type transport system involved in multi-copper enzyme maturation permease subunit
MRSILMLTYYEYLNRKIFVVSIVFYGLMILTLIFGVSENANYFVNPNFLSFLFYFSLIVLLISGCDMITRTIEDGSIELLLSRPIYRSKLLLYKYISTVLVIPIGSFLFFISISLVYLLKSGSYNFIFIRLFFFSSLTFAIYYASVLPTSLFSYRSNLNLLVILLFIMANILPNLISRITMGQIELTHNYLIGFFYIISPRLVELCGLAANSGEDIIVIFIPSIMFVLSCLVMSLIIINKRDF